MAQMFRKLVLVLPLALLLTVAIGCSGGGADLPELAQVTGTVTLDGQPLEGASILFNPTEGGTSYGSTDIDGKYSLIFNADATGAVPGTHSVQVSKYSDPEVPGDDLVPPKYNTETTLTADVSKDGPNEFSFDLKTK